MEKITVLGDIMCEPLLLRASKRENDTYDFSGAFAFLKPLLRESDFVIANLETPVAGRQARYVHELFSFNAPDAFVDAVKEAGIDFVTTANNHCLDRGVSGLERTMSVLEQKGLAYTGTCDPKRGKRTPGYFTVNGVRFALISYTLSTNTAHNHVVLNDDQSDMVNLLKPQEVPNALPQKRSTLKRIVALAFKPFRPEQQCYIKRALHMPYTNAYSDDYVAKERMKPHMDKLKADIREASEKADIVIFYPHTGGQFNAEPGAFTQYVVEEAINAGCDLVVGSHPHVVHKASLINGRPCFYSLGNVTMSPNSIYLVHDHLPDYGIMAHLYVDGKRIARITFSIIRIVETKDQPLTVYPVDDLYEKLDADGKKQMEKCVRQVYRVVTGSDLSGETIRREYDAFDFGQ